MTSDNWKSYKTFKTSKPLTTAYYDLVKAVFVAGVKRACGEKRMSRAIDLGCGSGELTRCLLAFSDHVMGVDSSEGLIQQARVASGQAVVEFVHADILDESAVNHLPFGKCDLVTATWLHNHMSTQSAQKQLLETILRLLKPKAQFVFLIPSDAFTSVRVQRFIAQLDWHQAWLEEGREYTRGVFRFANSPWKEMTVWQPMWLGQLYQPHFSLEFLDVKTLSLEHGGLGEPSIEPPFDVMIGRRKSG